VSLTTVAVALAAAIALGQADPRVGMNRDRGPATGGARATTTSTGTVIARHVDKRRGLVFEVWSSPTLGSGLTVRLARDAPQETRDAVMMSPLVGTCDVPGEKVGEFAGHRDERVEQYGTALMTSAFVARTPCSAPMKAWMSGRLIGDRMGPIVWLARE